MDNQQLRCNCNLLISNINYIKSTIHHSCCRPNHEDFKKEQKYIKKLIKKLDDVLELLNESP